MEVSLPPCCPKSPKFLTLNLRFQSIIFPHLRLFRKCRSYLISLHSHNQKSDVRPLGQQNSKVPESSALSFRIFSVRLAEDRHISPISARFVWAPLFFSLPPEVRTGIGKAFSRQQQVEGEAVQFPLPDHAPRSAHAARGRGRVCNTTQPRVPTSQTPAATGLRRPDRPRGLGPSGLGPGEALAHGRGAPSRPRQARSTPAPFAKAPAEATTSVTRPRTHRGNDSPGPSGPGEP